MNASMTALVVVADPALRTRLNIWLSKRGVSAREAATVAAAMSSFTELPSDIVLAGVDIGGERGLDLLPIIRARPQLVPLILIGPSKTQLVLASLHAGADAYVPLPLTNAGFDAALGAGAQASAAAWEREQRAYQQGSSDERTVLLAQVQADSLALMSRLAANLAHEINNPLTPIIGLAELLLDEVQPESQVAVAAEAIITSAQRIAGVVYNLRGFTQPLSQHMPVDLRLVVSETITSMEQRLRDEQIDVQVRLPSTPVRLAASVAELKQALFLLCEDARAAMTRGGTLRITLEQLQDQDTSQPYVLLQVIDTATPIPAYHLPTLFEPFYAHSTAGSSTGPGLAVVRRIIELHGGNITVEPHSDAGNTFRVRLPMT